MSEFTKGFMNSVINAKLPWNSLDACDSVAFIHTDSQERINKCCECSLPECVDCLSSAYKQRQGRVRKRQSIDHNRLDALIRMGVSKNEVCSLIGCSRQTYYRAKNKLGKEYEYES